MHCVDELDIVKYQPTFRVIKDIVVLCCAFHFVDSFYSLVKRRNQLKKNYVVGFFCQHFTFCERSQGLHMDSDGGCDESNCELLFDVFKYICKPWDLDIFVLSCFSVTFSFVFVFEAILRVNVSMIESTETEGN